MGFWEEAHGGWVLWTFERCLEQGWKGRYLFLSWWEETQEMLRDGAGLYQPLIWFPSFASPRDTKTQWQTYTSYCCKPL